MIELVWELEDVVLDSKTTIDDISVLSRDPKTSAILDAADNCAPRITVAVRYAFAKGRIAVNAAALRNATTQAQAEQAMRPAADAVRAALRDVLPKALSAALQAGGDIGAASVGVRLTATPDAPVTFDAKRTAAQQWLKDRVATLSTQLSETSAKNIAAAIAQHFGELKDAARGNWGHVGRPGQVGGSGEGRFEQAITGKPFAFEATHWAVLKDAKKIVEGKLTDRKNPSHGLYVSDENKAWHSHWMKGDSKQREVKMDVRLKNPYVWQNANFTYEAVNPSVLREIVKNGHDGIIYTPKDRIIGTRQAVLFYPTKSIKPGSVRVLAVEIDGVAEDDYVLVTFLLEHQELRASASWADDLLAAVGDVERAQRIADTESVRSVNQGVLQAFKRAVEDGYLTGKEKKEWITKPGCCDYCDDLDGEQVLMDEEFSSGDDTPPAHPNCRCSLSTSI